VSDAAEQHRGETGLVRLDPSDREQLDAIARLHEATLPGSAPVRFGRRFMTRFYFPKLAADGLAVGDLFRADGRWAGYAWYTPFPRTFLREAARRHLFFLCRLMPAVVADHPRALLALPHALRNAGGLPETERTGYLLTTGVDAQLRRTGVATQLIEGMLGYFRKNGFEAVEATVDRDNHGALSLYRRCGFDVEDRGLDGGAKLQVRLEFE
jgi:ribosomal protein S18 acetylase RimI-like enzyme